MKVLLQSHKELGKFRSLVSTTISNSLEIRKIENLDLVCSLELAILESSCKSDFVEMRANGIEILLGNDINIELEPATYAEGIRILEALKIGSKRSKFIKNDSIYETAFCVDENGITWKFNFLQFAAEN